MLEYLDLFFWESMIMFCAGFMAGCMFVGINAVIEFLENNTNIKVNKKDY